MESKPTRLATLVIYGSLTVIGFGIGWLVGLSVSPVVSIVITSLTGSVAAIVAVLTGLENEPRWSVNPLPTAVLVAAILVGSLLGLRARNDNWFGQDMAVMARRWQAAGLEMSQADIVGRLFESQYPANGAPASEGMAYSIPGESVLFSVSATECDRLFGRSGEILRDEVRLLTDPQMRQLAEIVPDVQTLERIVVEVLCVEQE
jgi:hypothetical protein